VAELLTERKLEEIITGAIGAGRLLFFFFDYDGTLTPIVSNPGDAVISEGMKTSLRRLAGVRGADVAVVSGRPISELKRLIGEIPGVALAGQHGLQCDGIEVPELEYLEGEAARYRKEFDFIEKEYPGCYLEEKKAALSVHYRNVRAGEEEKLMKEFFDRWEETGDNASFQVTGGKKVFEIRPKGFDKGGAVLKMLEARCGDSWPENTTPLYFGDDATDEDAFHSLNRASGGGAVTVLVDRDRPTGALYRINSVETAGKYINTIVQLLKRTGGHCTV